MKKSVYSKSIADAIHNFLTEDDWHFSFDDQRGLYKFGLSMGGKIKKISYIVDVKENGYIVYAVSPIGADDDDEKVMSSMAEFVCRANYGLKNGNLEFDMRDGEIRFKCFVDCEGITPSFEMVKNSIYTPAAMFDRYAPGIANIIFGSSTAKEAIAKCEKTPVEELRTFLSEASDEDGEDMLARIAARFGVDVDELRSDEEQPESLDVDTDVKTELFKAEGGVD